MKKIIISLFALFSIAVQAQTFPVNNLTAAGYITAVGNVTAPEFIGASTNIYGGVSGNIPCQTAANTTGFIAAGTTGYFLQAQSSGCPSWVAGSTYTPGSVAITGGTITGTGITALDGSFSIENTADNTKIAKFSLSGFPTSTTYTYTLPSASGTLASLNTTQIFTTAQTFNSSITVTGTSNLNGLTNNIGNSTIGGTQNIGNGATLSGNTQTINIGTAGASGSTTNINLGSATGSTVTAGNQLIINPATGSATELQVGSGSTTQAGLYLGYEGTTGFGGIFSTAVTPSTTNYALAAGLTGTYLNNASTSYIAVANNPIITAVADTASIKGTVLGGNAAAGQVGEFGSVTAGPVSLTSSSASNITSLSLTAGDWDVWGTGAFTPAGSTVVTVSQMGISAVSLTFGIFGTYWMTGNTPLNDAETLAIPIYRYNLTSTTTVYCIAQATFTTSTATASCNISARRVR